MLDGCPAINVKVNVKVANEWQELVTGLGLEIKHGNHSMIDAQAPSPPNRDQEKQGCGYFLLKAESSEICEVSPNPQSLGHRDGKALTKDSNSQAAQQEYRFVCCCVLKHYCACLCL